MNPLHYHELSIEESFKELQSSPNWLSTDEVFLRTKKYGQNIIVEKNNNPVWKMFLRQFTSALVIILIIATAISAFIGDFTDASIIFTVVILNALFWFIQEYKADKAIQSLKKIAGLKSKVIRNAKEYIIEASQLTLWDIILLDTGDKIPTDARLLEAINLEVQESILTGESLSVVKHTKPIKYTSILWDIKNMIFNWTIITKWRGKAIVCAIGMDTQIGKIAEMIQETTEKATNLEKKLDGLSKSLWAITICICIIIFLTYVFIRNLQIADALLTAVALAVAAIPEWLPAVVTISLWLWVKRFVKKNVLVRRLSSIETLWSVDVICTDKTGTLTKNEMTVTKLFVDNQTIEVSGIGYQIQWSISKDSKNIRKLLEIGFLCNNSKLQEQVIIWDPTEWALIVSALKWWLDQKTLLATYQWSDEIPFDSERKMMSAIYQKELNGRQETVIYTKGAIENLLPKCTQICIDWNLRVLDHETKKNILQIAGDFSTQALRVLWFAYGSTTQEEDLIFVWLQAMIDPPREEVKEAIAQCKIAWIRVIMITGDNLMTAKAIGKELGIKWESITGEEFAKADNKIELLQNIGIFARVNPADKQTIVTILQSQWHIVAMTGDGVNDAPALKMADIWIWMWITGTDVSKEASDMVLIDDNFTSIIHAIQEWRWIYDNIQKFVNYLLASNIGEILILFIASLVGIPLPLLAIHLLWINLITDGLPAIALGIDPINPNVMKRQPRSIHQSIIGSQMIITIIILSSLMTIWVLFLFLRHYESDVEMARSGVFILLVSIELIKIHIVRSQYGLGIFSNKWLLFAIAISMALALSIVYIPGINTLFEFKPLNSDIWIDIGFIVIILTIVGMSLSKILQKNNLTQIS